MALFVSLPILPILHSSRSSRSFHTFLLTFIIIINIIPRQAYSQEPPTLEAGTPGVSSPLQNQQQNTALSQLRILAKDIDALEKNLASIDKKISRTKDDVLLKELQAEKSKEKEKLESLNLTLEQIATGAVDLSLFRDSPQKQLSFKEEIRDVLSPILYEVKQLTRRPRQLEKLRNSQAELATQLEASNIAISEIQTLINAVDVKSSREILEDLLARWQERQSDIDRELQLIEFQLNEKISNGQDTGEQIAQAIKEFITGRGLNLLIAFGIFALTFFTLRYFGHLIANRMRITQGKESRFASRLAYIFFQFLSVLLSIIALLVTLYFQGDWLILTLLMIFLFGVAFALRNSIPRYADEVRLLLNLGSAREGERVIYNGLPWKISRLNVYSDLINPALTGGRLKLPMREVITLVSRRWSKEEPWFPTKQGDYVVLEEDMFGQVVLQTPEVVELERLGGAIKFIPTADFLAMNPRNLQSGFGIFVTFGLDYGLQAIITTTVLEKMKVALQEEFKGSDFGEHLEVLEVEFKEANSSSLDVLLICIFKGEAAKHYVPLKRFIQNAAVNACNKHSWVIPFNQLSVHLEKPE